MIALLSKALTSRQRLFLTLAAERATLSAAEIEAHAAAGRFVFDTASGVSLWYDPSHVVGSPCGRLRAIRAISEAGDLVWFCTSDDQRYPLAVLDETPHTALAIARNAWARPRTWRDTFFGRHLYGSVLRPARGFEGIC